MKLKKKRKKRGKKKRQKCKPGHFNAEKYILKQTKMKSGKGMK